MPKKSTAARQAHAARRSQTAAKSQNVALVRAPGVGASSDTPTADPLAATSSTASTSAETSASSVATAPARSASFARPDQLLPPPRALPAPRLPRVRQPTQSQLRNPLWPTGSTCCAGAREACCACQGDASGSPGQCRHGGTLPLCYPRPAFDWYPCGGNVRCYRRATLRAGVASPAGRRDHAI